MGFESLERRALLAHVGLDVDFGDLGRAPVDASVFVSSSPDGKVLAVGETTVSRLNADGSVDNSFVDEGGAQAALGRMFWRATDAMISGQRLLVAGTLESRRVPHSDSVFVRAINLSNGRIDTTFGEGGFALIPIHSTQRDTLLADRLYAGPHVAALPDGSVVFTVEQITHNPSPEVEATTLHKLTPAGQVDATFGGDGEVVLTVEEFLEHSDVTVDPNTGRLVVLHEAGGDYAHRITRFHPNGITDSTLGAGAGTITPDTQTSFPNLLGILVQPDGKFVIATTGDGEFGTSGVLARVNADGTFDAAVHGALLGGSLGQWCSDPVRDSAGRIIATGDEKLFRVTPGFLPDPTFDDDGVVNLPAGFLSTSERAVVAVDAHDRVLIGSHAGVARFAASDTVQLGPHGIIRVDGNDGDDTVTAVVVGSNVNVTLNGRTLSFPGASVGGFVIDLAKGDNRVQVNVNLDVTVSTGMGDDFIATAGGDDSIVAGNGSDTITTGDGDDAIDSIGPATVISGNGDDHVAGGIFALIEVDTGPGDDVIEIRNREGLGLFWGGDGNDRFRVTTVFYQGGVNRLHGEAGNDTIDGDEGNDLISGGPGDDWLDGYGGDDVIDGGAGNDVISGSAGADSLYGQAGNDVMRGDAGDDYLEGGKGDDMLFGQGGADQLFGLDGNDTLFSNDGAMDIVRGGAGTDRGDADDLDDVLGVELLA
jgi:uncharacterized delta-60 repeat protein